jgi:hypothetical protein
MAPKLFESVSILKLDIFDEPLNEFGLILPHNDDNDDDFFEPEIRYCIRCEQRRWDNGSTDFCRECLWDILEHEIHENFETTSEFDSDIDLDTSEIETSDLETSEIEENK